MINFDPFLSAYPPESLLPQGDVERWDRLISAEFGVQVPSELLAFWTQVGPGYYGQRELYFFGIDQPVFRDSLIDWNKKDFWQQRWPDNRPGQLLFFAETCVGDQIAFANRDGMSSIFLCCLDSAENYLIAQSFEELFSDILSEQHALVSSDLFSSLIAHLGSLPDGMHFAPIVSPLLGGSSSPRNYQVQTPDVHMISSIALINSMADLS